MNDLSFSEKTYISLAELQKNLTIFFSQISGDVKFYMCSEKGDEIVKIAQELYKKISPPLYFVAGINSDSKKPYIPEKPRCMSGEQL